jgi:hypothetical protein
LVWALGLHARIRHVRKSDAAQVKPSWHSLSALTRSDARRLLAIQKGIHSGIFTVTDGTVRGHSRFCRDEIMAWCEGHSVDYVLGVGKNARLIREIQVELA